METQQRMYASLFSYDMSLSIFKAFCEVWCRTTSTFCTKSGDMVISLWDLQVLGGPPADGAYEKEVILSVRELLSTGCGSFLFFAFHRLCQDVHGIIQLPAFEWICFWFRGRHIYTTPPSCGNRN